MSGHRWAWRSRLLAGAIAALLPVAAMLQERPPATARADLVVQALSLLGTPYRYGGTTPELGLDCSGLVRHVYAAVLSRDLPRRSEEISAVGQPVSRAELQPGDLVFFNTLRRAFSHVAIYIGEGRFIHAPARRGRVRIEGLDDAYWAARFNGARRLIDPTQPGGVDAAAGTEPKGVVPVPAYALFDRPPEP